MTSKSGALSLIWRLVAYLFGFWAMFFVTLFIIVLPAQHLQLDGSLIQAIFGLAFIVLFFAFTRWFARRFDEYDWSELGLARRPTPLLHLTAGFGLAAMILLGQLLIEWKLGWAKFVDRPLISGKIFAWYIYPCLSLIGISAAGFCEELAFRGYVWRKLRGYYGSWTTLAASTLFFVLVPHVNKLNLFFFGSVCLIGLVLGWFRQRTGALWFGIGFHWAWDWAQGGLWGSRGYSLIHVEHSPPTYYWANQTVVGDDLLQTFIVAVLVMVVFILSPATAMVSKTLGILRSK